MFVTDAKVKQIDFMFDYFDDKKKRLEIVRLEIKRKEERKAKRKEEREAKHKEEREAKRKEEREAKRKKVLP